jgi:hypothetical protein
MTIANDNDALEPPLDDEEYRDFLRDVIRALTYKPANAFDAIFSLSLLASYADDEEKYEEHLEEDVDRFIELWADWADEGR